MKTRQNKEILSFLSNVEREEKLKKRAILDCSDEAKKELLGREYAQLNANIQSDLKKIMQKHKHELDQFQLNSKP
jgi:hypothetical protein